MVGWLWRRLAGGPRAALFLSSCTHVMSSRARLAQTLPPCIALRPGLTRAEVGSCVFPSLLLPAMHSFHLLESPSGLRGLLLTACERLSIKNPHLSEKASPLLQVLQVRRAVPAQALPLGGEALPVSSLREEVCSK